MNHELPDVQAGFRKGRGTRDQIANWITEKAREFQKNIYFCFIGYAKALSVWTMTNCGKFLKRQEYQTILSASWDIYETGHGTMDWFQIGKGVCQGYILSSCLYAEYVMQNARLDEAQAGTKIARRNINNLRYAVDTTLMAESKQQLKSLLIKVKEGSTKLA